MCNAIATSLDLFMQHFVLCLFLFFFFIIILVEYPHHLFFSSFVGGWEKTKLWVSPTRGGGGAILGQL